MHQGLHGTNYSLCAVCASLWLTNDEASRSAVRVEFAGRVDESGFGSGCSGADVNHLRFTAHKPRLRPQCTNKINLHLECRVSSSWRQRGMDCATHCRIEQCRREAAMHNANRIVMVFGRLDGEDREAFAHFDEIEVHQVSDWRPRQLSCDDFLKQLQTR